MVRIPATGGMDKERIKRRSGARTEAKVAALSA
jgi:hypothetical protein